MAKNVIRSDTDKEIIYAVGAAYDSGDYIADGGKGGISLNDVASGADAVVSAHCVVEGYAKAAGQTWDEGELLYFDAASDEFTTTAQADGLYRAKAYKAALLAATTGDIELIEPIPDDAFGADEITYDNSTSGLAATDVQAAIDEVDDDLDNLTAASVAYDNSTSGLAAADVQDAIDEVEGRVDTVETDKMDLVATPTAGNLIEQDATGQGVDSGVATADVQVLTVPTAAGNIATLDATGALTDSTVAVADVQVLTVPTSADNIATLSAAGALQDSTVAIADVSALIDIAGDEVRKSTATPQTLGTGVAADIAFEVSEVAGDITVNVGNTEFTVPTTGMYAVDVSITFAGNAGGTSRALSVLVDGTASKISDDQSPDGVNPVTASEDGNLYLTAAQVVKVQGTQDSGGDLNVTAGRLMIKRIQ